MADEVGLRGYRVQDPAKTLARRREIMLAMAEVIINKGYASATLEDVATHMGTSRAVIYYQFRSKEDLYAEIVVEAVSRATERLEAILARNLPSEQALFAAISDLVEVGMEPLNRSTLVTGRPRTLTPESRARIKAVGPGLRTPAHRNPSQRHRQRSLHRPRPPLPALHHHVRGERQLHLAPARWAFEGGLHPAGTPAHAPELSPRPPVRLPRTRRRIGSQGPEPGRVAISASSGRNREPAGEPAHARQPHPTRRVPFGVAPRGRTQ